jgi:glutamate formiminotransferase
VLECVINVSTSEPAGIPTTPVLDVHSDHDHNRSVLTMVGDFDAVQNVVRTAVASIDLREHAGVHPRIGAVDVVPWVDLDAPTVTTAESLAARDRFAQWAWEELRVPSYLYGTTRALPEVRRAARRGDPPDVGDAPHPTAGAIAAGARPVLVAYNLWLAERDAALARRVADDIRRPEIRTLALVMGDGRVQVSCNLVAPYEVGPDAVYDLVAVRADIDRAELVGLIPRAVLDAIAPARWSALDLSVDRTIEARLA